MLLQIFFIFNLAASSRPCRITYRRSLIDTDRKQEVFNFGKFIVVFQEIQSEIDMKRNGNALHQNQSILWQFLAMNFKI